MERVGILLAVLVGCSVAAEPTVQVEDSAFSREFPRLFQDIGPLPIQRDFVPVFSSWPVQISDFHLLEDWPPVPRVPRVEVSCDGSKLNVLVWKDLGRVPLTAEEVQLGDGCYSTAELPHHLVFTYNLDECGTSYVVSGWVFNVRLANPFLKGLPDPNFASRRTMACTALPTLSTFWIWPGLGGKHPPPWTSPAPPAGALKVTNPKINFRI